MLPLAILCGGLGTRMRPRTLTVPKPMIDVNGEPFLAHLLRAVARAGIDDVVLLIGYLGESIVDFAAGGGSAFGLRLRYAWDGERPLGTAGAVRSALPLLGERFLVTYGDAYLQVDYAAVIAAFEQSGCSGLMTVYRWSGAGTTPPNAGISDGRVTFYDKEMKSPDRQYVDYGLSAFHARAFDQVTPGQHADLALVNRRLIANCDLAAFIVEKVPLEIGSPEGLDAMEAYLKGTP